ncbi:hypothetical protein GCM10017673_35090 [Streptosporangium violaceochromogenes]|nr:hypothetical protein GCM10017673_35090 [Streptosporangium violaceochromogenes]
MGPAAAVLVAVADTVHRWRTHEAVRTWRKGALGERRTARMPRPLARRGYTILHDRAIPGSRANVDHLVIGGAGVFVVDTKHVDTKHSEPPHVVTDEASSTAAGKHRLPDQRLFPVNQPPL